MTAFNDVFYSLLCSRNPQFATESIRTPPRELTIKKNFKLSTAEFTKICHFEIIKQKKSLPSPLPVGQGNTLSSHPLPSVLRPPNFELSLSPLSGRKKFWFHAVFRRSTRRPFDHSTRRSSASTICVRQTGREIAV